METIFAQATAPGRAGVSVVRLSGPGAFAAVERLAPGSTIDREMRLRTLRDQEGETLDQALVAGFKAPASFTGQDVVELHLHGSVAVVSAVLRVLGSFSGLRLAEPGEFTRLALENGKMNLTQVEGLADLIDAETEAQRRQATRVLSGALGKLADSWRAQLIRAAALLEATIDFADEDVPEDVTPEVRDLVSNVMADLKRLIGGVGMSERIRNGFEIAIVGPPNAGKSTLLNALAGRDAAITSEFAGTTRDVIEVRMDLGGLAVTFLDTAGLREAVDHVEKIGISVARQRAEAADIRVFLADDIGALGVGFREGDVHVLPKGDLRQGDGFAISGLTGQGLEKLISVLTLELSGRSADAGLATRVRHRLAMGAALDALAETEGCLSAGQSGYELAAESLRHAVFCLESLVGRVNVENLLDEIFASFCLGK